MRPSEALERHRDEVLRILKEFRVINPRIFGSVARGEDVEGSDLDIILELEESASYFNVFRIEDALTELLGVPVDVRTPGRPGTRFAREVEKDAMRV
ncbi:nucleotidyltransferase family protein [Aureimonas leprariae]|uniref:Nucleotidyltransferase family protein n=1 Tax=Plantimonas leprariae TaxID=2615207 RepID=A0A7V7PQW8_9HYPH|nr:nucleotidyltransferase family protein [Aureimonas leprariae]KAB0680774.1 nucleotidyltransferase family protein [Aureimonas leprariae]